MSVTDDNLIALRCSARTHVKVSPDGRYVRSRCLDPRCKDYVYGKMHDLICIHVWDLWHEDGPTS